jgi:hypothetical protein
MNERDKELALECQLLSEHTTGIYREALQTFADLIRADEREACAKVCETLELPTWPDKVRQPLAQAIRARGNNT